jgi:hypothetical protein
MNQSTKTALTLAASMAALVAMMFFGIKGITSPLPHVTAKGNTCKTYDIKKTVTRTEVAVSVYNASTRAGLATDTINKLTRLGFKPGETGNAPEGTSVKTVIVWTTTENDPTAALVAAQFKQKAQVVVVDEAYGPGVDVLLGAKFKGVLRKGPKEQPLAEVKKTCID